MALVEVTLVSSAALSGVLAAQRTVSVADPANSAEKAGTSLFILYSFRHI